MKFSKRKNRQSGQAMLIAVFFFLSVSTVIVVGIIVPIIKQVQISKDLVESKKGFYLASGATEDALYRLKSGATVLTGDTLSIDGRSAMIQITTTLSGRTIRASADQGGLVRNVEAKVSEGLGASFNYGVQVGDGGFTLSNSSTIKGNVYSNGPIVGSNSNIVYGDVVSAGPNGMVDGVHATSSIYAHNVLNSTADKDVYYTTVANTRASGALCPNSHCHPNSSDQQKMDLPITDDMIAQWESDAADGGTATCSGGTYNISGGSVTLGPKKIPCDLNISGTNTVITLGGALWVTGNINISNQPVIKISSALSGKSVPIIADKPTNQTSSSKIFLSNGTSGEETFQGAGENSYILFLSQNKNAQLGGGEAAIVISNSVNGDALIYAGHGLVTVSNSIQIKELTAYKVQSSNTAQVIYSTGLASLLFSAGPSGGWEINSWKEVE